MDSRAVARHYKLLIHQCGPLPDELMEGFQVVEDFEVDDALVMEFLEVIKEILKTRPCFDQHVVDLYLLCPIREGVADLFDHWRN